MTKLPHTVDRDQLDTITGGFRWPPTTRVFPIQVPAFGGAKRIPLPHVPHTPVKHPL